MPLTALQMRILRALDMKTVLFLSEIPVTSRKHVSCLDGLARAGYVTRNEVIKENGATEVFYRVSGQGDEAIRMDNTAKLAARIEQQDKRRAKYRERRATKLPLTASTRYDQAAGYHVIEVTLTTPSGNTIDFAPDQYDAARLVQEHMRDRVEDIGIVLKEIIRFYGGTID